MLVTSTTMAIEWNQKPKLMVASAKLRALVRRTRGISSGRAGRYLEPPGFLSLKDKQYRWTSGRPCSSIRK